MVAQLRKLIGKSQSRFAAMVGVSKHTIISVENGRNQLSRNLVQRIQMATGANFLAEDFRFEPVGSLPLSELRDRLDPRAIELLRRRYDGTGKNANLYTREDFDEWRANFYPSNDAAARKHFDQIKQWVEIIFRAAAKPGVAGNRDRLPAVRQSLVEWLNETLKNFKLENEVDGLLEEETHEVGETGYSVSSLKESKDLARIKEEFASYGYDFAEVQKHFKKAKSGDWVVLETECRQVWDPFNGSQTVPCATRKLRPKPEFRFVNGWDYLGPKLRVSKEQVLQQVPGFQAQQSDPKSSDKGYPLRSPKPSLHSDSSFHHDAPRPTVIRKAS